MQCIGNILTNKPYKDGGPYNVVDDKSKLINGLPTIIVGWEYTKSFYPDVSAVEWQIDSNLYWTYGKREKRMRYEDRMGKFYKESVNALEKRVHYNFLNLFTTNEDEKKSVLKIFTKENICIYINQNMVYIYDKDFNNVWGISLEDIEYGGKSSKNFLRKIYAKCGSKILDKKSDIPIEIKNMAKNKAYLIPYLCY